MRIFAVINAMCVMPLHKLILSIASRFGKSFFIVIYAATKITTTFKSDLNTLNAPSTEKSVLRKYSPKCGSTFENLGSIGFVEKIKPLF